jgi:hypothetical protein
MSDRAVKARAEAFLVGSMATIEYRHTGFLGMLHIPPNQITIAISSLFDISPTFAFVQPRIYMLMYVLPRHKMRLNDRKRCIALSK